MSKNNFDERIAKHVKKKNGRMANFLLHWPIDHSCTSIYCLGACATRYHYRVKRSRKRLVVIQCTYRRRYGCNAIHRVGICHNKKREGERCISVITITPSCLSMIRNNTHEYSRLGERLAWINADIINVKLGISCG